MENENNYSSGATNYIQQNIHKVLLRAMELKKGDETGLSNIKIAEKIIQEGGFDPSLNAPLVIDLSNEIRLYELDERTLEKEEKYGKKIQYAPDQEPDDLVKMNRKANEDMDNRPIQTALEL